MAEDGGCEFSSGWKNPKALVTEECKATQRHLKGDDSARPAQPPRTSAIQAANKPCDQLADHILRNRLQLFRSSPASFK
jgi:hypothetical protein